MQSQYIRYLPSTIIKQRLLGRAGVQYIIVSLDKRLFRFYRDWLQPISLFPIRAQSASFLLSSATGAQRHASSWRHVKNLGLSDPWTCLKKAIACTIWRVLLNLDCKVYGSRYLSTYLPTYHTDENARGQRSPWSDKFFSHDVMRKDDVRTWRRYLGEKRRIERGLGIGGLDVKLLIH